MNLHLNKVGKRFNFQWIFKNIELNVQSPATVALRGNNGSGKTTLLSLIAGYAVLSEGTIEYTIDHIKIEAEQIYKHLTWCSPATELPEEFTLIELLKFQQTFKNWLPDLNENKIVELLNLTSKTNEPLKNFSTGMKQRVKVAMAVLADVSMVLLDEPTSNLDDAGIEWYKNLVQQFHHNRLFIIASNAAHDFVNTTHELAIDNLL